MPMFIIWCILIAYFIHNILYLLISSPYTVPLLFPLPASNDYLVLYIYESAYFCYIHEIVVSFRFHI